MLHHIFFIFYKYIYINLCLFSYCYLKILFCLLFKFSYKYIKKSFKKILYMNFELYQPESNLINLSLTKLIRI